MPNENENQLGLPLDGIAPIMPAVPHVPLGACCADCGASEDNVEVIRSADGTIYCEDHHGEHFTICAECSEELDVNDVETSDNGSEYHEDCYREVFCRCDACNGELHREDDTVYSPEDGAYDYLCESCYDDRYTRCNDCDGEVHNDNTTRIGDNDICDSCRSNNYSTCDDCGEHVHNDDSYSRDSGVYCSGCEGEHEDHEDSDDDEGCDCTDCRRNRRAAPANGGSAGRAASPVRAFSHTSNSYQRTRSKRRFSVELETSKCDGYQNYAGKFYFQSKDDGSISGKEFVTKSYADKHGVSGDKGLDAISAFCGAANADGFEVDNQCGYHAHFNVDDLSNEQLKAVAYAYNATANVWSAFVSRARRDNRYCGKNSWGYSDIFTAGDFYGFARRIDRYQWFNVASYCEHKTFELRLHGGTLDASKVNNWVVANLRFIDAMSKLTIAEVRAIFNGKSVHAQFEAIARLWDDTELTDYYIKRADKFGTTFAAPIENSGEAA